VIACILQSTCEVIPAHCVRKLGCKQILESDLLAVDGKSSPMPAENGGRGRSLQVHSGDNVLVALVDLKAGEEACVSGQIVTLVTNVPAKHKFATSGLESGDAVIMYGVSIGRAVLPIRQGELITTKNVRHHAAAVEGKSVSYPWTPPDVSRWRQRTFLGFARADGQVGTRNHRRSIATR
jgi:hypothetical protein